MPDFQGPVHVLVLIRPVLEAVRLEALAQGQLQQLGRGIASSVGTELINGAVVDLVHGPEQLRGHLHVQGYTCLMVENNACCSHVYETFAALAIS